MYSLIRCRKSEISAEYRRRRLLGEYCRVDPLAIHLLVDEVVAAAVANACVGAGAPVTGSVAAEGPPPGTEEDAAAGIAVAGDVLLLLLVFG